MVINQRFLFSDDTVRKHMQIIAPGTLVAAPSAQGGADPSHPLQCSGLHKETISVIELLCTWDS